MLILRKTHVAMSNLVVQTQPSGPSNKGDTWGDYGFECFIWYCVGGAGSFRVREVEKVV